MVGAAASAEAFSEPRLGRQGRRVESRLRFIRRRDSLLHFQHQALQVFGLGQVEYDGMVKCGAAALKEACAPRCIGGGSSDCALEIGPSHMMRAGAGDEKATGAEHLERAKVQLFVAAQRAFNCSLGFGEGRRIEDDDVKFLARLRPVAENFKRVSFDPVDFRGDARAVGLEVALRHFKRGMRNINARHLAADLGEMKSESALVAANVKRAEF
jgi:hypothetical protein